MFFCCGCVFKNVMKIFLIKLFKVIWLVCKVLQYTDFFIPGESLKIIMRNLGFKCIQWKSRQTKKTHSSTIQKNSFINNTTKLIHQRIGLDS